MKPALLSGTFDSVARNRRELYHRGRLTCATPRDIIAELVRAGTLQLDFGAFGDVPETKMNDDDRLEVVK